MAKKGKVKPEVIALQEKPPTKRLSKKEQRIQDRPTANPKKETLIEMQQIDGKLYNKYGYKSLDEILGINTSKYKTHDVKEYELMLARMNVSDLQAHAISVQVMPKEDRRILTQLLIKQFKVNNSSVLSAAQQVNIGGGKKMSQDALDVLGEGR